MNEGRAWWMPLGCAAMAGCMAAADMRDAPSGTSAGRISEDRKETPAMGQSLDANEAGGSPFFHSRNAALGGVIEP